MSYAVKDSLGGKRITLVYDAALVSLPVGGNQRRLARSRQAGRHMRQHRARAALFLMAGGNAEHWWAARASGVTFAAGIMQWLYGDSDTEEERPHDFHVLIPLDGRVYLCTVAGGMIGDERVLPPDQALLQVDGEDSSGNTGVPVFAWQVGERPAGTAGAVDAVVPLEQAPFGLSDVRLNPLWLAFARNGLMHRSHALIGALAVLPILGILLLRPVMEIAGQVDLANNPVESILGGVMRMLGLDSEPETVIEVPEMREIIPMVPHGAAGELRRLSAWLSAAEGLYRDGVIRLEYGGGALQLEGRSPPRQYPSTAEALAIRHGGEFSIAPAGWLLSLPAGMPSLDPGPPEIASVEVIRHMTALPHALTFASGPSRVPSRVDPEANTFTRELTGTGWRVELTEPAIGELLMLAESLDGLPGALTGASCLLGEYRLQSCEINLEIQSL